MHTQTYGRESEREWFTLSKNFMPHITLFSGQSCVLWIYLRPFLHLIRKECLYLSAHALQVCLRPFPKRFVFETSLTHALYPTEKRDDFCLVCSRLVWDKFCMQPKNTDNSFVIVTFLDPAFWCRYGACWRRCYFVQCGTNNRSTTIVNIVPWSHIKICWCEILFKAACVYILREYVRRH